MFAEHTDEQKAACSYAHGESAVLFYRLSGVMLDSPSQCDYEYIHIVYALHVNILYSSSLNRKDPYRIQDGVFSICHRHDWTTCAKPQGVAMVKKQQLSKQR